MNKLYQIKFNELFESKRQAVVSFLSLERKYLAMCKHHRESADCHLLPATKEVANVCSCPGLNQRYRLVDLKWVCSGCGGSFGK